MHSNREPLETLDRIQRTIGEYTFAGQYQQSPAPLGGGLVKTEWFKRYRENERPERLERIMQSWDTANKATELSDFSVCTTWGVSGKNLFLLGLFRRRLEYPTLKRAVREPQNLFNADFAFTHPPATSGWAFANDPNGASSPIRRVVTHRPQRAESRASLPSPRN